MIRKGLAICAAISFVTAPAIAQTASPESAQARRSLDWMVGEWAGEGTFFGRTSHVTMSVKPIIDGQGIAFDYKAVVSASGKDPAISFSAHAFLRMGKNNRWDGQWVDGFGNLHDIGGRIDGQSLRTIWGSPGTEIGRSHYANDGGAMTITDQALRANGQFEIFATSRLVRK